jgi:hypothetical protein
MIAAGKHIKPEQSTPGPQFALQLLQRIRKPHHSFDAAIHVGDQMNHQRERERSRNECARSSDSEPGTVPS